MSPSGHFRAHGRRDVDLSAALDRPDPGPGQDPAGPSGTARPSDATRLDRPSLSPSARPSGSPPSRERQSGISGSRKRTSRSPGARDSYPARDAAAKSPKGDVAAKSPKGDAALEDDRPRIRIVNLSLGGACIEVVEPIALGTPLTLEILAPTLWDPLVLRGKVVWSRGDRGSTPRAGLSFEHADAARAYALFELLGAHDYDV
jgi:hypothetical protein